MRRSSRTLCGFANAIEHALVFRRSEFIEPEDLPNSVTERKSSNAAGSFDARVNDLKRTLVERAVVDAAGDFEVAAARLGLSLELSPASGAKFEREIAVVEF